MSINKIQIVMAHYNGSRYVGDQIRSIRQQETVSGFEVELLIVDDRSRPDELAALRQLCAQEPWIRIFENESNLRTAKTFEYGLSLTTARYVMLADQDDVWLPHKIRTSITKLMHIENQRPALVFTNLVPVDSDLNVLKAGLLADFEQAVDKFAMLFQNQVTGCTVAMNRELLELALPFPHTIPMHDHWLAICAAFGGVMSYISEPTMLYRQHASNLVGAPNRSLRARLAQPRRTLERLRGGLEQKAAQTAALADRLRTTSLRTEAEFLDQVAKALVHRDRAGLRFLRAHHVFRAKGLAKVLLALAYRL